VLEFITTPKHFSRASKKDRREVEGGTCLIPPSSILPFLPGRLSHSVFLPFSYRTTRDDDAGEEQESNGDTKWFSDRKRKRKKTRRLRRNIPVVFLFLFYFIPNPSGLSRSGQSPVL
jgi:hypothetical protein